MLISISFKTNKYILLENAYTFLQTKYKQYENSKSNYVRLRGILMLDVLRYFPMSLQLQSDSIFNSLIFLLNKHAFHPKKIS